MLHLLKKEFKFYLSTLLLLIPLVVTAQKTTNELIKNKQRAILVYNFTKQIEWENIDKIKTFTIGVLGNNPILKDFEEIFSKRNFFNKKTQVKRINTISEIKNLSLLYVNADYNYDINSILKKTSKKNTLIISENYKFNSSMINIIDTDDGFFYELNTNNLYNEGFNIHRDLKKSAINSESKWLELYKEFEKDISLKKKTIKNQKETLIKQKNILSEQKDILSNQKNILVKQEKINIVQAEEIKKQETIITNQFDSINKKKIEIEKLASLTNDQRIKYAKKITILDSLEEHIVEQQLFLKNQSKQITGKENFIKLQVSQIEKQKKTLLKQKNKIKLKNTETILAYIIIIIFVLFSYFFYKKNKEISTLNTQLVTKNNAIEAKTKTLKAQNTELEQFAYIASHDLQEPLNTITSFIQLIKEDNEGDLDANGKQSLKYISQASLRMKELIKSLLDYSQLGKSKEIKFLNPNEVLTELQSDLNDLIKTSNTEFNIVDLPLIYADRTEIRLLFQNLITNAIKFSKKEENPKITITYKLLLEHNSKKHYKFSVNDNGIGIKENHINKIFAIFQRLHNKEEYEGTGIGLAHCKKIVESLNGDIGVESIYGKGSSFWFTIPC